MTALVTSRVVTAADAWADVTPTGSVVIQGDRFNTRVCLSADDDATTAIDAPAFLLRPGETMKFTAAELGDAFVLVRANNGVDSSVVVVAKD